MITIFLVPSHDFGIRIKSSYGLDTVLLERVLHKKPLLKHFMTQNASKLIPLVSSLSDSCHNIDLKKMATKASNQLMFGCN